MISCCFDHSRQVMSFRTIPKHGQDLGLSHLDIGFANLLYHAML